MPPFCAQPAGAFGAGVCARRRGQYGRVQSVFSFGKNAFKRTRGGVLPGHLKNTSGCATEAMPIPKTVRIHLAQHVGKPCEPTVKPGQEVFVGTVIGRTEGGLASVVHASVSGKVSAIEEFILPNSIRTKAVVIQADGAQTPDPAIAPPEVCDRESFLAAVRESGLIGLGGAGFPTYVKLTPQNPEAIDTLIINGAECEPFLTADYRECLENGDDVLEGVRLVQKYLGIRTALIGIEGNKPEAIAALTKKAEGDERIQVRTLVTRYPQGAEKVIVNELTGRVIPKGKLPADVGVVVLNISTVAFIARYLKTGTPLVEKRITVDGDCIKTPKNVLAPVGASIADVAAFCGGYAEEPKKILLGGPMMGMCVYTDAYNVAKNTNGLLFLGDKYVKSQAVLACMKCGRCADACPMGLMPPQIYEANKVNDMEEVARLQVDACMECGCCAFVCPSKRPVTQAMREAKANLRDYRADKKK
nr:electron transport complex subunit RsxC [Bittarella massiliensis (ex Durand et al. 2017)]